MTYLPDVNAMLATFDAGISGALLIPWEESTNNASTPSAPLFGSAPAPSAWSACRLVTLPAPCTVSRMSTATKLSSKKPARKRAAKKLPAHGIKAAPGNPFAGLEHVFGSIALPPDPRPPREIIRARILADHNT